MFYRRSDMRFEWDDNKNRQNLAKHGVHFETATLAFDDPGSLTKRDLLSNDEERWSRWVQSAQDQCSSWCIPGAKTMEKKSYVSFRPGQPRRVKGKPTRKLTEEQKKEVGAIRAMRDKDIDLSDMPEILDWSGAEIGKFYRPAKKSVTMRLDSDVLQWLKGYGKGYQTRVNLLLRHAMANVKTGGRTGSTLKRSKASFGG
jgi:uncharacterized protein (DUF4415 family)